ncbi:peptidoglycan DD-metalloendopeptidase family protein [Candidatus Saccharibacteria bacterium]|nr:MAG: peptidoglycan DD-metalloendopeptidase family protein [Candidatus Saccharibacteria bacterium]
MKNKCSNRLKSILAILSVLLILGNVVVATAEPLDGDALDMVLIGSVWYEKNQVLLGCLAGGVNIPNGSSEQNGKAIFDYLTEPGRLTPVQAAGIIGNMVVESGLLPQRKQNTPASQITTAEQYLESGSTAGWGLVQWTPGVKFISSVNPETKTAAHTVAEANNLGVQIAFVWSQLEGKTSIPEKQAGDDLKQQVDLREAVLAFQGNKKTGGKYVGYERPADQSGSVSARLSYAIDAMKKYGSFPSSDQASAVSCGDGGSSSFLNGNYSLPVDKKWFDQHPEWFSKPHHDYPAADIPVPPGQKVYAVAGGKITSAPAGTATEGLGYGVIIDVGGGVVMQYGHGSDGGSVPGAKKGDTVEAGQLIMHSASTGNSTGPHLHFAIKTNGKVVCPQNLLMAIGKSTNVPDIKQLPTIGCSYPWRGR